MENKARKMFAAVVVIMLCAVAIVGVGYAYTATTTNDGNTTQSQYAILKQDDYKFGVGTVDYKTETSMDRTEPLSPVEKITYTLVKPTATTNVGAAAAAHLYKIGEDDTITATDTVSGDPTSFAIALSVGEGFSNIDHFGNLVVKIAQSATVYYYAYYDYDNEGTKWTYWKTENSGSTFTETSVVLTEDVTYTTSLYLDVSDDEVTRNVTTGPIDSTAPPILDAGEIVFTYSSA